MESRAPNSKTDKATETKSTLWILYVITTGRTFRLVAADSHIGETADHASQLISTMQIQFIKVNVPLHVSITSNKLAWSLERNQA